MAVGRDAPLECWPSIGSRMWKWLTGVALLAAVTLAVCVMQRPDLDDAFERLDELDADDLRWRIKPARFTKYIDGDVEVVSRAASEALKELGYETTGAGAATRDDGARVEFGVSRSEHGLAALEVTLGVATEFEGELDDGTMTAQRDEWTRLANQFFEAVERASNLKVREADGGGGGQ